MIFTRCSLSLFSGYHPQHGSGVTAPVSWFQSDTGHYLFNTRIDLWKNHFSGLMVVKPLAGDSYRVVFITEVGLKIFDMEFSPGREVKVHYIMEAMNRKALIKTLSNDMSLVLMNSLSQTPEILSHRNSTDVIFRYRQGRLREYYFLNNMQGTPHCIRQTSCVANKVGIDLYGKPYTGPDSIKIRHYTLQLSLNLYRIKENAHAVE